MSTDGEQLASGLPLKTGLLTSSESEPIEKILAAGEDCFCRAGYPATSMRAIAELAGVSKSLLHYHFQSKEHLFLEVQVRIYNRIARQILEATGEGGSPAERGLAALDAMFKALRESPDLQVQAKVWASSLSNEGLQVHARRMRELVRGQIIRTMEQILGPAHVNLPMSLEAAADLLWAAVSGLGLQASTDDETRVVEAFKALQHLIVLALQPLDGVSSDDSRSDDASHLNETDEAATPRRPDNRQGE